MLVIVANVFYVLVSIAMIVLILLQRGAGAAAGSGFGGGASATVFGARGSANFLSRSTAVLAGLFFLLSLGMGMYLGRGGGDSRPVDDPGLMAGAATSAKPANGTPPMQIGDVPQAGAPVVPADTPAPVVAPAPEATAPTGKPAAASPKKGDGKDGK
ncbi:MAG: preprotein translocase subunit SecG [Dokdonella sp.]|uniref:preprotein translocase subunit SecG n=1 Tax=Dokdonella sp. TaxID=2291710 RepID=UPI0032666350